MRKIMACVAHPAYLRDLLAGKAPRALGHNPLAGMMVLALMAALIATGASGWLMTTDAYRSARWLEEAHEALASFTLALVAVHVAAVLLMSAWHGENLVRAMITGGSVWNSQRAPSIRHRSGAVGRRGGHWIESYSASMIVR